MINLLIGIVLVCAAIFVVVVAVRNTPANLQGFYGKFYCFIALVGVIAGIYLGVIGILSL